MRVEASHLLLVDDSALMRRAVVRLLHTMGFGLIDEAADGLEALERFVRVPYDVVLTDWGMPNLNGLELLRAIRTGSVRSATPVLLFTGEVTGERVDEAFAQGASGFIAKPFIAAALQQQLVALVVALPPALESAPTSTGTRP
jgi:two-component system chemotaxis response regulator CheY